MDNHIPANRKKGVRIAAAIILLVGLGSSALVYLRAQSDPHGGISGEYTMEESMRDSKKYVHDLELFGGKANLIASDFVRWYSGLWEGTQLAFTIATLTIATSGGILFFDNILNAGSHPSDPDKGKT